MEARLLRLGARFARLGRGGTKGDQEMMEGLRSSLLACAACLSISFSACGLWVLPGDKRPEQSAEESLPPHQLPLSTSSFAAQPSWLNPTSNRVKSLKPEPGWRDRVYIDRLY